MDRCMNNRIFNALLTFNSKFRSYLTYYVISTIPSNSRRLKDRSMQAYSGRYHGEPCMDPMCAEVAAAVDSWIAVPGHKKGEPSKGRKQYMTRSRAAATAKTGQHAKTDGEGSDSAKVFWFARVTPSLACVAPFIAWSAAPLLALLPRLYS
uniref:Uncharacterized protein n=1 Tax=Populus trichocarpa TaxID=3694 RepID=A0A2K1YM16_POPTR